MFKEELVSQDGCMYVILWDSPRRERPLDVNIAGFTAWANSDFGSNRELRAACANETAPPVKTCCIVRVNDDSPGANDAW